MSWLESLKAGDPVLIKGNWDEKAAVVEKVGKLHITVDGLKFRKASGSSVDGTSWSRWYLRELDKAAEDRILERKLRAHIEAAAKSKTTTLKQLVAMKSALEESK